MGTQRHPLIYVQIENELAIDPYIYHISGEKGCFYLSISLLVYTSTILRIKQPLNFLYLFVYLSGT